ncbi:glycoside hydrolase family 3 C-terminal domain-containing protein [Streptomyces sp. NPDC001508]|uniref:beta-glucosidase family protein n=1 Tax=Streptomyces sp. NPDC001508 TaxID=3154656 RepID=UPI0033348DC8
MTDQPQDLSENQLRKRVEALSLRQKVRLLTGEDFWSVAAEPLAGLRRLVFSDGPAGVRGEAWDERNPSANVPSPTALAATWDESRIERLGGLLAAEARRKGVDVLLAPTINLHRTPYGGRHFECFSEDPVLTGRIGAAYVRGLQSAGVGATVKHFVANDSETERFTVDVQVAERVLRELYLAPFEAIVREARAWVVMAAYNAVNGTTMTEHPLLREVLKDEWGFDGLVVSDWYAGRSLAAASDGLLDLVMPGPSGPWGDALVAAVAAGHLPEHAVDDKVLRLLRLAGRVGALDGARPATPSWTTEQSRAELRETAAAGFVLARNEPAEAGEARLLPLSPGRLRRVAVVGPNAAVARTLGGGSATVFPPFTVSPLDGLRAALGPDVCVDHARGGRSSRRVPAARPEMLYGPNGHGTGVELCFFDTEGTLLGSETRESATFTWLGGTAGATIPIEQVAAFELRTRVRADSAGTYLIGAAGVGRITMTVGGSVRIDTHLGLTADADPVERMMRPPQETVPVPLDAGEQVGIMLRYEPPSFAGEGFTDAAILSFQLLVGADGDDDAELAEAVALAGEADVAVVVVGTTDEVESEGFDRASLSLPVRQDELVRRVRAANPRTVVAVNAGAPVLLPWADEVPAVLLTWFPGQEFGNALADVLLGISEPGGRLPVTWPQAERGLPGTTPVGGKLDYNEGLFIGYRRYERDGEEPLYRFGHGLGYTTWECHSVELSPGDGDDGAVIVTVRLHNTGTRRGREVVQVFLSRPDSAIERVPRWLAGFGSAEAEPDQQVEVRVALPRRAFEHWDAAGRRWAVEAGEFQVAVQTSSGSALLGLDTGLLRD